MAPINDVTRAPRKNPNFFKFLPLICHFFPFTLDAWMIHFITWFRLDVPCGVTFGFVMVSQDYSAIPCPFCSIFPVGPCSKLARPFMTTSLLCNSLSAIDTTNVKAYNMFIICDKNHSDQTTLFINQSIALTCLENSIGIIAQ